MTCGKTGVARNLNRLKLEQADQAQAAILNRQPSHPAGAFYLMHLRMESQKTLPFRRRLQIVVEPEPRPENPSLIKIIHAGSNLDSDQD